MMPLLVSPTAKQGIRHQPIGSMMQVSWNRSSRFLYQSPAGMGLTGLDALCEPSARGAEDGAFKTGVTEAGDVMDIAECLTQGG
jgi:hypothetical protein